jgi:exodeoxyribonuclease V beta subunit
MNFNVLDPTLNVRQSRIIEASAGTGKTFAIQHLVIRFILLDPLVPLSRMAIITFTRKATQSLKERLRLTLQDACQQVRSHQIMWPYLQSLVDLKGQNLTLKRLLEALFHFEQIQINTIHSFAYQLVQRSSLIQTESLSENQPQSEYLLQLIQAHLKVLSRKAQSEIGLIELVRDGYHWDLQKLAQDLAYALQKGLKIGISDLIEQNLEECWAALKHPDSENVYRWALEYANDFKGACKRNGQLKFNFFLALKAWQKTIEKQQWVDFDRLVEIMHLFQEDNLKRGKVNPLSNYFKIWKPFLGLVRSCKSKKINLEKLAKRLFKSLENILGEDERIGFDIILRKLVKQLDNDSLAFTISQQYDVIIVDEFQDTDPQQWFILKKLYEFNSSLCLILVGDPKQSIYAFRQADIYTYLEAKKLLQRANSQEDVVDRLTINYRSHPKLVEGLNYLFDEKLLNHWLALPRVQGTLSYPPVLSGRSLNKKDLSEVLSRIEFFKIPRLRSQLIKAAAEYIARVIQKPFISQLESLAVLVSDHRSAFQLQSELTHYRVPCQIQRPQPFASLTSSFLYEIAVNAWSEPDRDEKMKAFWSNPIFQISSLQVKEIFNLDAVRSINFWRQVQYLNQLLIDKGIGVFHEAWLDSSIPYQQKTIREYLSQTNKGKKILHEWSSLVSWLSTKHQSLIEDPQDVRILLKKMLALQFDNEALYVEPAQSKHLQIMTIHASKGLEFDVVFSLGTVNESYVEGGWMQTFVEDQHRLASYSTDYSDDYYLAACDELDAEKARRLYVAWTRAKEYLFIAMPDLSQKKKGTYKRGLSSPMDLYMASWSPLKPENYEQLYQIMNEGQWQGFIDRLELLTSQGIAAIHEDKDSLVLSSFPSEPSLPVESGPELDLAIRLADTPSALSKISFSSLSKKNDESDLKIAENLISLPLTDLENNLNFSTAFFDKHLETMVLVPKGKETGIIWHSLMQQLVLLTKAKVERELLSEKLLQWCLPRVSALYQPWLQVMIDQACRLYFKSWQLPDRSICLDHFRSIDLWPEKPFSLSDVVVKKQLKSITKELSRPWLHGVIDLIMIDKEEVFFIDWKSNWLGAHEKDYQLPLIFNDALKNNYDIQATIYSEAIQHYLDSFCEGKWQLKMGIYVYMRSQSALFWDIKLKKFINSDANLGELN